jgi:hypothetical protein
MCVGSLMPIISPRYSGAIKVCRQPNFVAQVAIARLLDVKRIEPTRGRNQSPATCSVAGGREPGHVGKAGLPARLGDENADPNLQMWYLHRSMDCTIAPEA